MNIFQPKLFVANLFLITIVILTACTSEGPEDKQPGVVEKTPTASATKFEPSFTQTIPLPTDKPAPTNTHEPTATQVPTTTPIGTFNLAQVNEDGFGDSNNIVTMSLEKYGGYLYAGLLNFRSSAKVWRFDGSIWELVMEGGFDGKSLGVTDFIVFGETLYAGTIPQFTERYGSSTVSGSEIWRSKDGLEWEKVVDNQFNSDYQYLEAEISRLFTFDGYLYAAVTGWTGDPSGSGLEIWRSKSGDAGSWEKVADNGIDDPWNTGIYAAAVYNEKLYVGTIDGRDPVESYSAHVYVTEDGVNWDRLVNMSGEPPLFGISAMNVFKDYLYVAAIANLDKPSKKGHVYRCAICDGSDWELVLDGPYLHSRTNRKLALEEYKDHLFYITGNDDFGLEIWKTFDGIEWERIAREGINDNGNLRSYWDNANTIFQDKLMLGVTNTTTGTEVWAISLR